MKLDFREMQVIKKQGRNNYDFNTLEMGDYFDWKVEKIYYLTGVGEGERTGEHCHKEEIELFVMVQGKCTAIIDRGNGREEFKMEGPSSAIYAGAYVWHGFKDFSENAILLAIASKRYNPDRSDYIEDYEEYKKIISAE